MTALPYPWDLSIDELDASKLLNRPLQGVYRAEISLGSLTPEICNHLTRNSSPENGQPLRLESVSIEIGPIEAATLASPDPIHVGWVALRVSGPGYFYPWTPEVAIDRVRAVPDLMAIAQMLETAWPNTAAPPAARSLLARVGELVRPRAAWRWITEECG